MPPPPLPPVVIPQNNNPIPTAITSPGGGDLAGMLSPGSSSNSSVRRAAPEPNKRALYVGGLDPRVTEDVLRQIFETTGHVQNVKIIPDKNLGAVSGNPVFPEVSNGTDDLRSQSQQLFTVRQITRRVICTSPALVLHLATKTSMLCVATCFLRPYSALVLAC